MDNLQGPPRFRPRDPGPGGAGGHTRFVLEVLKGRERGKCYPVAEGEISVGRGQEALIQVRDSTVSRLHIRLEWDPAAGAYWIRNCSHTNPARVNGVIVTEALLREGDRIQLGGLLLQVKAAPTARPSADPTAPARSRTADRIPVPSTPPAPPRAPFHKDEEPTRQFVGLQLRDPAKPGNGLESGAAARERGPRPQAPSGKGPRLDRMDLAQIFGQLAVMMEVGIPLSRALEALSTKGSSACIRDACALLLASVSRGSSLSEAARNLPDAFSPLHIQSLRSAEASSRLPGVLRELSRWEERDLALTRAVKGSLTYPAVVFTLGVGIVALLGHRVFGTLGPILTRTGKPLPLLTQILFGASALLQKPLFLGLMALLAAGLGLVLVSWLRTSRGRQLRDRLLATLPLVGSLVRKLFVARFCNHLSLLYQSGIPLLQALNTTCSLASNTWFQVLLRGLPDDFRTGMPLSVCMQETTLFPRLALGLVMVGEESGDLAPTLQKVAEFYDEDVYRTLDDMVKVLEPLMIGLMGVVVAVIVLGTLLPLYRVLAI